MNKDIEVSPFGSLLVYKKGYTADDVRLILKERGLRGLRIFAHLSEDRLENLEFLRAYSFLEALDISSFDDYEFDFLEDLPNLKDLAIAVDGKNVINLSNQAYLNNLTLAWRKDRITGLENCHQLNSLCLIDYDEKDLKPIAKLRSLQELTIKTASIISLEGIDSFSKLKYLRLGNCRKLKGISGLINMQQLAKLSFECCPNVGDLSAVGNLSGLNDLQLDDCSRIDSIEFVDHLAALVKLSLLGNSSVADGDLIPAKSIKEVFYKHRKHYNIKLENKDYERLVRQNLEMIKK
ncbi:hypothetical protein [Flavihumibacter petaseus]|uniref:R13L1/DRL21-like LRR repeat region domain-containing protein n=1 Tax=Flavihumibacter petaseus NBRC 106054 TaxID=1220578 RepID=A0A0E9MV34_9BACT|nr:hypothetical protein [Flavihumibacter petaseus]GAO41424.1 hypothetical protein FPE01S_01_04360 [Flavihumibacter petaseus NBRC 106054]